MTFLLYALGHSPYPQYLEDNGLSESMLFQLLFDETHEFNWTIPDTCPSIILFIHTCILFSSHWKRPKIALKFVLANFTVE